MKTKFISYALCGGLIVPGFIAASKPLPIVNGSTHLSYHNDNANNIASDDRTIINESGQDFKFRDVMKSLTNLESGGYYSEQFLTIGKPNRTLLTSMNYSNTLNRTRNIYKKYGKNFLLKQNLKKLKQDKTSKSFPKFSNNTKPLHDLVLQMVKNGKQRISFNSTEWNLLSGVFNSLVLSLLQADQIEEAVNNPSSLLNLSSVYQKISVIYDSLVSNQNSTAITLYPQKEEEVSSPAESKTQDILVLATKPIRKLVDSDELVSSKNYRKPSSYSLSRVISFFKDYKANKKYKYYDPDNLYETKIVSAASVKDASSGSKGSLGSGNYTVGYNITFDGSRRFKFFPAKKNSNSTSVTPSNSNSSVSEIFSSSGSHTLVVSFCPLLSCLIFGSYLV